MEWRFWKRLRRTSEDTVEETRREVRAPEPARADAPRFEPFHFEAAPLPAAPIADPEVAEDVRSVMRRKTGRRLPGELTPRSVAPGFEPVLVPSLREHALVYRLAAEERSGSSPAEALELWRAWLSLCPDDGEAWMQCGRLLLGVAAREDAETAFREARRCSPRDPLPSGALGYLAGCVGDWAGATLHFTDAVALAPHDLELVARLAEAQEHAGQHEAAHDTRQRGETLRAR